MTLPAIPNFFVQFFDDDGAPLSGGKLYTYEPGTTTNKATYTAADGVTPNANPVVLDSNGRAAVYLNGSYRLILKDSSDNTIYDKDNVYALDDGDIPSLTSNPFITEATVASATTTDIGAADSNCIIISGTTTISALGSSADVVSPIYFVRFTGALTLTHNASSLILPGGANITTANGDSMTALYLGSGNWKVLQYTKISGYPVVGIKAAQLSYTLASGNNGPSYTGADWRTVEVNTEDSDVNSIVTLSSNRMTPIAGTYMVVASHNHKDVNQHFKYRWRNVTAGSTSFQGNNKHDLNILAGYAPQTVHGIFTANGTDAFELQIYPAATSDAPTAASIASVSEIYTTVTLLKIA